MTWLRLDDGYCEDERFDNVSLEARWLHLCALHFCARNLTDGHIKGTRITRLSDVNDPKKCAAELVKAGLWNTTAVGYVLPDYLRMNRNRVQTEEERAAAKKRKETWLGNQKNKRNGVPNGVSNGAPNTAPPYPSLPVGEGKGVGGAKPASPEGSAGTRPTEMAINRFGDPTQVTLKEDDE